ncbi:dual specificity protein phosphatase CDC14AB isoform X2 [Plutella xylostella]|uniref:dual specificity protein phosphatase CDC14AB isoform X2 n=1 Tax=Plutella xylostella TaxID=51655 RepID=UPI002032682C|nr:dual specificity protein phosphatase CDC14AB isoform X2 [Plutella xylostella]
MGTCLGRTGSLIGAYLMKHYRMTALEAISWMRICRPGSVIGHQQDWLQKLEPWLIKQGNLYRKRVYQNADELPIHPYGVYSIAKKDFRQRATILRNKSPSPPPPFQRGLKSYIEHPIRPQASKVREASDKKAEKHQAERRPSPSKNSFTSKNLSNKGNEKLYSRSKTSPIGAGDPRIPSPSQTSRDSRKSNVSHTKNLCGFQPMPPFHVLNTPIIKNINDAKNFLLRPYSFGEEKRRESTTPSKIVTHYSSKPSKLCETLPSIVRKPPSQISTTNATATGTAIRGLQPTQNQSRRLGRSPSPSPTRSMSPVVRNSPSPIPTMNSTFNNRRGKDKMISSRSTLPSLGAASLGARRTAPGGGGGAAAPSVRSDERPLATQGDMLNSIKLQRRLKESMQSDRNCALYNKGNSSGPIKQQHSSSRQVKPAEPSMTKVIRKQR